MKHSFPLFIAFLLLPGMGFAQWQPDTTLNTPVCTAAYRQTFPRSASDGHGGVITCWQDNRNGDGLMGMIYVQRLDSTGTPVWDSNGIRLSTNQNVAVHPKIIADGQGGAFVAWIDSRYPTTSNTDVFAQHINAAGVSLWRSEGVEVDSNMHTKAHISLALDGKGGLYLAWDEYSTGTGIFAQHLDSTGSITWGSLQQPNPVAQNAGVVYAYEPQIIPDGRGGFIAVWYDNRHSNTDDIYAQRIDTAGNRVWNSGDVRVSMAQKDQKYPQIASNGANGVLITWQDDRANYSNFNPEMDIYAQALDSNGVQQWLLPSEVPVSSTGIAVCTAIQLQLFPQIVSDQTGGAYISWIDRRAGVSNPRIYLQHLNSQGDTLFQANGLPCSGALSSYFNSLFEEDNTVPAMCYDADSGLTLAWTENRPDANIYAQRINAAGVFQWDSAGRTVSTALNGQYYLQLVPSIRGTVICVWQDNRGYDTVSANDDIYASQVPIIPQASNQVSLVRKLQPLAYPNPTTQWLHIRIPNLGAADAIHIYDSYGRQLKSYGRHSLSEPIDLSEFPTGLYFIRLVAGQQVYNLQVLKH